MARVRFHVAGESHSPGLLAIVYGLPAGVPVDFREIKSWLKARRTAGGRGKRQHIEVEEIEFLSGVRDGVTHGGPVAMMLGNRDRSGHSRTPEGVAVHLEFPRPGHADAAGARKWGLSSADLVAEKASGRITAAYTAVGALCSGFLEALEVESFAHVNQIGTAKTGRRHWVANPQISKWRRRAEQSEYLCIEPSMANEMSKAVARARKAGDTLGGEVEVVVAGLPTGLGEIQPMEERLDSRIGATLMGIPSVRAVALGDGFDAAIASGKEYHDAFCKDGEGTRCSNRAGGVEGGLTNGEPVVTRIIVKPLPSLGRPLASRSLVDGRPGPAHRVRSDVTAVPAVAWVARGLVSWVLVDAIMSRFGGDRFDEIQRRFT